jgi:hypothetical protein
MGDVHFNKSSIDGTSPKPSSRAAIAWKLTGNVWGRGEQNRRTSCELSMLLAWKVFVDSSAVDLMQVLALIDVKLNSASNVL